MAETITKLSDVVAALGRPISAPEDAQVETWISRVEGRIRIRVSDLDERVTDPAYKSSLVGVVVDVVIRKILNPAGFRSERIDDYYYDRGSQKADLWPTDDEWRELIPDAVTGAFSTRPGFVRGDGLSSW